MSVVIPAYNATAYLVDCLNSVFAQRGEIPMEVIVVDDGSTDTTWAMVARHPRIMGVQQSNQGPAAARNTGIARARGEFIAFLDADDLWPSDKLRGQIELLQAHPEAGMIFGDCRQFDSTGSRPETLFEEGHLGHSAWGPTPHLPDAYVRLLNSNFVTTGSVVARRRVFQELGGFDESLRWVEDLEMWLRIARRFPILWTDRLCLLRRRHGANLSRDAMVMGQAYLSVLNRQKTLAPDMPAYHLIRIERLIAREQLLLAGLARHAGRHRDALAWTLRGVSSWLAVGWCWLSHAGKRAWTRHGDGK